MDTGRKIDKVFLLHIWACVPFVPLWVLGAGEAHGNAFVNSLRYMTAFVGAYLIFRTYIVFRGVALSRWALLWCIVDCGIVTAILVGLRDAEDPTCFLYFLAIAYAGLRLSVRQVVLVAVLTVAGQFGAGLYTHTWDKYFVTHNYMYVAFRQFFLLLVASLITFLRRESQDVARRLALNEYQRDIAAEMHDGIQHDLVLMARRLDLAEAVAQTDPGRAAMIAVEQRDTARRVSDELRFLIHQTRTDMESGADFIDGLRRHVALLADRFDKPIEFAYAGPPTEFPAAYQHDVLRVIQEALTNSMKHSQADRFAIRIREGRRNYHVRIADSGVGFDPDTRTSSGFGLPSIAERIESLGGRLNVITRPGKGTVIIARLPVQPSERKAWYHGFHSHLAHRG
jgi:signal transduction histidine kinase